MTFSEKLEKAIDIATATDDWIAAGKLIIFAFERGFINAETAVVYRQAVARTANMNRGMYDKEYSGPARRAALAKQPLRVWASTYKR